MRIKCTILVLCSFLFLLPQITQNKIEIITTLHTIIVKINIKHNNKPSLSPTYQNVVWIFRVDHLVDIY